MADIESNPGAGGKPPPYKDPDNGSQRFLLELEFVQCLANPTYIHYLAQNRYFEDEAFIGYLKYLKYWQRPEYIKYIMYPHCLLFLELLRNANFRNAMTHPTSKELAHRPQYFFWKNYRNNRMRHILPRPPPEPTPAPSQAPVSLLHCPYQHQWLSADTWSSTCSCTNIVYATCGSRWCICNVSYAVCRNSWH